MLMALTNADRCSDLAALDLCFRSFHGMKFIIPELIKTRRKGPPVEAFYSAFQRTPESVQCEPCNAMRRETHCLFQFVSSTNQSKQQSNTERIGTATKQNSYMPKFIHVKEFQCVVSQNASFETTHFDPQLISTETIAASVEFASN